MKKSALTAVVISAATLASTWGELSAQVTPASPSKAEPAAAPRELPAVRRLLVAAVSDFQKADSMAAYVNVYDQLSKTIAIDSRNREAHALRGELVRRALRVQNSLLAEDEVSRPELINADGALRDFDKALAIGPTNDELAGFIFYGRGRIFFDHKNDAKRALTEFQKAIAAHPQLGAAYLGRAMAAGRFEKPSQPTIFSDYEKAISLGFDHAKAQLPEDATYDVFFRNQTLSTALHGRGLQYVLRGDNEKALADLNAALAASLLNTAALRDRARLHSAMNQPQKAIADLSALIAWRPTDAEMYRLRAAEYQKLGDKDNAAADLQKAAELAAGKPPAPPASTSTNTASAPAPTAQELLLRGDAAMMIGELDGAITEYLVAIKLEPKNVSAFSSRGWALARKREYSRAAADFDTAVQLKPDDAELLIARGQMRGRIGQSDGAVADLTKAAQLAPNNIAAWEQLGVVQQAYGKYAEAEAAFHKAAEVLVTDANARGQETTLAGLRLAIVRAVQNKVQNAQAVIEAAVTQQLRGAMGILDFELRKQPENAALKALQEKMQTAMQKLQ